MKRFGKPHCLAPEEAHQIMVLLMIKIRKRISNGFLNKHLIFYWKIFAINNT